MLPPRLEASRSSDPAHDPTHDGAHDPTQDATHDPDLTWEELVAVFDAVASASLSAEDEAWALAYLEANLPGAQVEDLLRWPGDWFGSRWLEEVELAPEDAAWYAADRAGRQLPGQPDDFEPDLPG